MFKNMLRKPGQQYIGWQWRNFFMPFLCQLFSYHDAGQALRNVCYCDITSSVRQWYTDIFLHQMIPLYSNKATNLHHLTSHSTTCCPTTKRSYCEHRLLWHHFTLCMWMKGHVDNFEDERVWTTLKRDSMNYDYTTCTYWSSLSNCKLYWAEKKKVGLRWFGSSGISNLLCKGLLLGLHLLQKTRQVNKKQ